MPSIITICAVSKQQQAKIMGPYSPPLADMLKKKKNFEWRNQAKAFFEELKEQLCSTLLLHNPGLCRLFSVLATIPIPHMSVELNKGLMPSLNKNV